MPFRYPFFRLLRKLLQHLIIAPEVAQGYAQQVAQEAVRVPAKGHVRVIVPVDVKLTVYQHAPNNVRVLAAKYVQADVGMGAEEIALSNAKEDVSLFVRTTVPWVVRDNARMGVLGHVEEHVEMLAVEAVMELLESSKWK